MSSSKMKLIQCYLAMIGFFSDKINILQHIKHVYSTIALAVGALHGMNTVWYEVDKLWIQQTPEYILLHSNRLLDLHILSGSYNHLLRGMRR